MDRSGDARASGAGTNRRVAITGATGFLGRALERALRAGGHRVVRIVRSPARAGAEDVVWDPAVAALDPRAIEGCDAVVHLAGEPIDQRWNDSVKVAIRASRVESTGQLARAIATLDRRPTVFISGSAMGIYGDRGDEELDERSRPGSGFLAEVVQAWEAAAEPARSAGVRVVHPRTGVVLGTSGGALARMLPPFKLGAGATLGDGKQWSSWIALGDWVAAAQFALATDSLHGPYNAVSPHPVTNAAFTEALGHALHRPTIASAPRFALRLLFGEMTDDVLLASQRARPRALEQAGFHFGQPLLEGALRAELSARD
ncbi:MAG: TIGR01777 family oxidoreductase [Gemmatimonadaceae bacterium]